MSDHFIKRKFPDGTLTFGSKGAEWRIDCLQPNCRGESHKTFSINLQTNLCYCYRCEYSVHLRTFLYEHDGTEFFEKKEQRAVSIDELQEGLKKIQEKDSSWMEVSSIEIEGFQLLTDSGQFRDYALRLKHYLKDRGWTYNNIKTRKVGFSVKSRRFFQRIIFPVYSLDGKLIWYQARTIKPNVDNKYINPLCNKAFALYNIEQAIHYDDVILVEGIFDCVLPNCVCIFGKSLSNQQLDLISYIWKRATVLLDNDAPDNAIKVAKKLAIRGIETRWAISPGKDPDTSSLIELESTLKKAELITGTLDALDATVRRGMPPIRVVGSRIKS